VNGPFKLAITGAHSTGKSTFLDALDARLTARGVRVGRIGGLAKRARDLGFPILANHTIESTLWIMAEGLRLEAELSLACDVILVDRPPLDALAYLKAGLEVSGGVADEARLARLHDLARASTSDYGIMVLTILDPAVTLGEGRDRDVALRAAADRQVAALIAELAPTAMHLEIGAESRALDSAERAALAHRA
jgi:hypothetical protein